LPAVLSLLAEAEFRSGDAETAVEVASRGLAAHRKLKSGPNNLLYNMAAYLTALGRFEEAHAYAREALSYAREEQAEADVAFTVQHLAAIGALRPAAPADSLMRSARLLGFVDARLAALDTCREYTEQAEYEKVGARLREALGGESVVALFGEGKLWNEDRAVQEAQAV
jgi:tetratricopeptide (TPR) repeat protein